MTSRRDVTLAGHLGDAALARRALEDADAGVRVAAIGALERLGALTNDDLARLLTDPGDTDADVRRRAAEAAALVRDGSLPHDMLLRALDDADWSVVEMSCWALGEHEAADDATLARLTALAGGHEESLVREAAVAALGAIGDARGIPAIIAATKDKATVRRRAAVALAPFETPEADAALRSLLDDRDWQTRQIAEDLLDERPT